MALGFVDLEKAFDTVPREMVMGTLRWRREYQKRNEGRMVDCMYEKTAARVVVVGEGVSEEFEVKVGLRQGSVLSPLLFIAVLDLISRKTVQKACHEETPLCRGNGPSGKWQTGATGDMGRVGRAVYRSRAEN